MLDGRVGGADRGRRGRSVKVVSPRDGEERGERGRLQIRSLGRDLSVAAGRAAGRRCRPITIHEGLTRSVAGEVAQRGRGPNRVGWRTGHLGKQRPADDLPP